MDNILNQKTRSFFDEVDLFKQTANTFTAFESIKTKEKYVSPFYATHGIKPGQNIVTDTPISDFNFTGIDENGNEGMAYSNDIKQFNTGTEVYDAFKKDHESIPTDLLRMYYEEPKNDGFFNFSGKLCLLNIGSAFYNNIIEEFPKPTTSFYHKNGKRDSMVVNSLETQAKYIKTIVDSKTLKNSLTEIEIYQALKLAVWNKKPIGELSNALGGVNRVLTEAIEYVASAVGKAQIGEERYLADKYSEKDYNPLIGTSQTLQLTVEGGFSVLQTLIQGGLNLLKEIETADFLPTGFKTIINKLQNFNIYLNQAITTIKQELKEIIDEVWKLANAFICGLVNGLISTLEFLLQIIAFLVGLVKVPDYEEYAKYQKHIESLEQILNMLFAEVPNIFNGFIKLVASFKNFNDKAIQGLFSFTKSIENIKDTISKYQIAYYAGNVVFEVIIGALLAIFTGGAGNAIKAAQTLTKKSVQFLKILGKEALSSLTFGIADLVTLFRGLIRSFIKACEKGFKGFIEWIRSLLSKEKKHLDDVLDEVEQISLKNYSKTEISTLLLQNNINKFYNSSDLDAIYKKALQLDMRLDDLIGFVKTGNIKEIKSVELLKQMDNYINIVLQRGYPFGFRNLKEFEQFCDILKSELSSIGLSTNDIRIQGSSLRKLKPKDLDLAVFIDDSNFNNLLRNAFEGKIKLNGKIVDISKMSDNELMNLSENIFNNDKTNAVSRTFAFAMQNRKISGLTKPRIKAGHRKIIEQLNERFYNLRIDDISIQTKGGKLELKPDLKIK